MSTLPLASRLFRDLLSAERSADAHRRLADHLTAALREVFTEAARRAADTAGEMEDDADTCRDAVIHAGLTPADYEAWLNKHGVNR